MREGRQVRSDLDQDRAGTAAIDSRNRLQQPQGTLVVGQCVPDARVQRHDSGVGPVDGLHLQRKQHERVERSGEYPGQRLQLGLYVARQAGQDAGVFQRLERGLPVNPGAFQGRGGDAVPTEPVGHRPQTVRECAAGH